VKHVKINTRIAVVVINGILLSASITVSAEANPLCASPEQRQMVQSALAESPKSSPAQIAKTAGLSEAAVVNGLPAELRTPVAMAEFDNVWKALTDWEDALVITLSSDSVFEMFGPVPKGNTERGYFNFDAPDSAYGGHLKTGRLAAIYLLSTDSRNGETHQVAFFDDDGRRVFSVYVPRDEEGALQSQPHSRFLRMKQQYHELIEGSFLTDAGCLWANVGLDSEKRSEPD
jgi:putative heme utilization carrier protein HutX